jgi:fatty-acyl-CoA synthase
MNTARSSMSTMMDQDLSLLHVLDRCGTLFPNRPIVTREDDGSITRTTYADVSDRALRLAATLREFGVRPGEAVATLAWNHARHLEAYLGVPACGAVLHTINPRLHADDLAHIVRVARDRVLLIDASLLELVEMIPVDVRPEHVLVMGAAPSDWASYDDALAAAPSADPRVRVDERAPSAMCFTSATTGRPKGVTYSHRSIVLHSIVEALPDQFDISGHDVVMPVVPMFHVNAWGLPYTAAMVGAGLVLPGPKLDGESILALLEAERVSFTAGVPTVWTRVLDSIDARAGEPRPRATDLSALRTVVIGGSAAAPALIQRIDALGARVLHAWGMTETSPLGSTARIKPGAIVTAEQELSLRATQGVAAPLVEMRVVADDVPVPWDAITQGELQVRGPWITGGYLEGEGESKFTDDGWLRTGDIVVMNAEGYMRIVDRASDLIKSGGEWISSLDLEAALLEHPAVAHAAVIAVQDPTWNERPLALVVTAPGWSTSENELRETLLARFAKWQIPDRFEFIDELPLTATGKIAKLRLREQYASTTSEGSRP